MNLPNKITLSRILLLPVFLAVALINFPFNNFVAAGLFIILAVTDFFDGYIARKNNIVTNLGKFLDPIADKLLCTTGLLLLIIGGEHAIIPNPFGIICVFIILLRDYAITGLRQIAQLKGIIIPADKLGKLKANFQYVMTVYGFLIGGFRVLDNLNNSGFLKYFTLVFYIVVGITTALVLISGLVYIIRNINVFKDDNKNNNDDNSKSNLNTKLKTTTPKKSIKNTNKTIQ